MECIMFIWRVQVSLLLIGILTSSPLVNAGKQTVVLGPQASLVYTETLYKGTVINLQVTPSDRCEEKYSRNYLRWIMLKSHCLKEFKSHNQVHWISAHTDTESLITYFDNADCVNSNFDIDDPQKSDQGFRAACVNYEENKIMGSSKWRILSSHDKNETYKNEYTDSCEYDGGMKEFNNITTAAVTPSDGTYLFVFYFTKDVASDASYAAFNIEIEIKSPNGYLSALDYPKLKFNLAMCFVYVICALLWCIALSVKFQYIGLYQNLIAILVLLSTVESTLLYCNYLTQNSNAENLPYASSIACILDCISFSLLYGILLCIATGYGITKSRQRSALYPIFGISILYFVVALIQGLIGKHTDLHTLERNDNTLFFTTIPIIVIQFVIMCWIYMASRNTLKMTKGEFNTKKTIMYRIFICFTLPYFIISILTTSGILFAIDEACLQNWSVLWKLNSGLKLYNMFIIMLLMMQWFPSNVTDRYMSSTTKDGEAFSLMAGGDGF